MFDYNRINELDDSKYCFISRYNIENIPVVYESKFVITNQKHIFCGPLNDEQIESINIKCENDINKRCEISINVISKEHNAIICGYGQICDMNEDILSQFCYKYDGINCDINSKVLKLEYEDILGK